MAASADRNLLFGIVALQMDFITRDGLVAAMNAWAVDKARPLGQILVAQQLLSAERHQLLEALVEEHVKQHGDDPQRSLQSVSSLKSVRAELDEIVDPDVQASLANVPAHVDDRATQEQPERTLPLSTSTSSGNRFRILRPWREGGLGKVSVAQDAELHREVALKEIKYRQAHNKHSRDRFLLEAEVTGALEHPGIVPVYGLGHYGDGRPFYAMRFVRGDSLEEAIERFHKAASPGNDGDEQKTIDPGQRTVEFRELLGRFVDVCNAVAYAHSRGVLHRDLKPGNIILGKYGETLVVDWGLAKVMGQQEQSAPVSEEAPVELHSGSGSAPTQMGSLVGTPMYMSPEQATGRLDLLGPASDVYSLGATLYSLLTGKSPFEGNDVTAILSKVRSGDFPRPRKIKKDLSPALDAICVKAMSLDPTQRYASPTELADDLEHWLADEQVKAYREPLYDRVRRWGRRHRALVTGSAALLVTAAVALLVSTVLIGRQQAETELQRQEAVAAKKSAEKNLQLAEANGLRAAENQKLAEQRAEESAARFQVALEGYQQLVFGVQNRLETIPGAQGLRLELLNNAQKGLEKLLPDKNASSKADSTIVWSHLRLGDVSLLMAKTSDAKEHFERGLEVAKRVADANPSDHVAQHDLISTYGRLSSVLTALGSTTLAEDYAAKCLDLSEALANANPENGTYQRDLLLAYERIANIKRTAGQFAQAKEGLQKCEPILVSLTTENPTNTQYQRDFVRLQNNVGEVHQFLGEMTAAENCFDRSLKAADKLAKSNSADLRLQRDLANCYGKLASLNLAMGEPGRARDFRDKELEILRKALAADNRNAELARETMNAHYHVADINTVLGDSTTAQSNFRRALEIATKLAANDPRNLQTQRSLAQANLSLGVALQRSDRAQAAEYLQKALDIRLRLAEAAPDSMPAQRDLAYTYLRLALSRQANENPKEVMDLFEKHFAIREKLAKANPEDISDQLNLTGACLDVGDFHRALHSLADANDLYRRALDLTNELARTNPNNAKVQRMLSVAYNRLGANSQLAGELDEAIDHFRKSLEIASKLADAAPNSIQGMTDLAHPMLQLANICQTRGQWNDAVAHYEKLIAVSKKLAVAQPKNIAGQRDLATKYATLASLQYRTNQMDAARQNYAQMLEIRTRLAQQFSNSEAAQRDLADAYQKMLDFSVQAATEEEVEKYRRKRDEVLAKIGPSATPQPEPAAAKPAEQSLDRPTESKTIASEAEDN